MSFAVLAHTQAHLAQSEIADAVKKRIGQPMRRAGTLAGMAVLACTDVLQKESCADAAPVLPSVLLWHSLSGPQPETEMLLDAQSTGDGLLMPFDFLASQPSLICAHLKPWVPLLEQSIFLPRTAHSDEQPWLQTLQLADVWLSQGHCQRVICAAFERHGDDCHYAAISVIREGVLAEDCHRLHGNWLEKTGAHKTAEHSAKQQCPADAQLWHMLQNPCLTTTTLAASWSALHLMRRGAGSPVC